MSLFSLLILVLRPNESIWRRRKLTSGEQLRVSLYRWILMRGKKAYRRLAVSDVISMSGGRVKVVHEYRDLEFERKLKEAKIAVPHSYKAAVYPFESVTRSRQRGWKWFNFTDTLSVEIDGQKVSVEHGELYKVCGSAKATAKRTGPDDVLDATFLTMAVSLAKSSAVRQSNRSAQQSGQSSQQSGSTSQQPRPMKKGKGLVGVEGRGVFGKNPRPDLNLQQEVEPETVDSGSVQSVPEVPAQVPSKQPPVIISKRGLDIDTSF